MRGKVRREGKEGQGGRRREWLRVRREWSVWALVWISLQVRWQSERARSQDWVSWELERGETKKEQEGSGKPVPRRVRERRRERVVGRLERWRWYRSHGRRSSEGEERPRARRV
jgi:hypothetical protein